MSIFDDIYKNNGWGFGSGHGSLPSVTKGYRAFLEAFVRDNEITSIVDYGCGDWQFSRLVDWGMATYTGVDIVETVIKENSEKYGSDHVSFRLIEPGSSNVPSADLVIVKDVMQHMSEADNKKFIKDVLPKFKFALITNCIIPVKDVNADIATGEFRPLDLRKAPYGVKATVIYSFTGPKSFSKTEKKFFPAWKKFVLLIDLR